MEIHVDHTNGRVSLHDADNFRAFLVRTGAAAGDADVAAALATSDAGRGADEPDHVWVAKAWLLAEGGAAPDPAAAEAWATGFASMVEVAAKMGWLDDDGSHIKAHIERG